VTDAAPPARAGCLVIGVGNAARGDDDAGRRVLALLRGRVPAHVQLLEHDGEAARLVEQVARAHAVYLIDAAVSGAAPGRVRRFDCAAAPLPAGAVGISTHGVGPAEAIELARALGRLPQRCIVYAIEAGTANTGEGLSDPVEQAARRVAASVAAELRHLVPDT
jgi:hydrogenase maturation protease